MMTSLLALAAVIAPQAPMTISVHLDQPGTKISPSLYGIFFEEINQAGDGGIYGEMLQNRGLERANEPPIGWKPGPGVTVVNEGPNDAHPHSFEIPAGTSVANTGFGGLAVEKGEKYRVTLWAKGWGNVGVGFGEKPVKLGKPGDGWKKFEQTIKAGDSATNVQFVVSAIDGPVNVGYVSLMPEKLWKNRKNGMRTDLAKKVDAIHPAFVRFPGGCYVEGGDRFADAFDWKNSIGPVEKRKGVAHSMWGYPNTFGLGFHEYLQWCEDMKAVPLFVVNCGINHRQIAPMSEMSKWVNDALDAIEYANGPVTSKWGAERAKNGHPAPFGLKYVEIGNENGGGFHGGNEAYEPRYKLIYNAIKAKYPEITTISNTPLPQPMDVIDEHYYSDPSFFWQNSNRYDSYDRKGPKIYVGEYAVTQGCGQGNLAAALGEAAFMAGMERNSDVVAMSSYAPLFVNVHNRQWNPNAIVFNASEAYGTPSYHTQALFANNRPSRNVAISYPVTSSPAPKLGGQIGLMTWATEAEFKDVKLTTDGKTEDLMSHGIATPRGEWSAANGIIHQSDLETDRTMIFPRSDTTGASRYSLSLKARKIQGKEGFIIRFDLGKDGTFLQWNVGGWGNRENAFQRNGSVIGGSKPGFIETNRWYDIRIEREGNVTKGYLDGKLMQELHETGAPDLAAVAGVDDKAKELVIKVINGSDSTRTTTLDLSGGRVGSTGKVTVLTGATLLSENSFDSPTAIAPRTTALSGIAPGMNFTFEPRSITVLRIPLR